ncbi:MAG: ATP-binding cassette domain-containing protein [Spirochaetales bacterium]|jgi:ABC-2 type transport system ATP-binding protein|nr:ATP-binding cassette domain-containing protein [Spirochaetales bacterium]
MIEAENLGKSYGSFTAVKDASFRVSPGEIVGLLGPNGAGKTSIMKILTGYHFPSRGRAVVGGCDVETDPVGVKAAVGYLPESSPVYGDFSVGEYLDFVAAARGIPPGSRARAVEAAISECGLEKMRKRTISKLSKGYRQRTGLAQAIIHNPAILILDEPTAGLDPNQIIEVRRLIRKMGDEKTVILSTHILQEVEALCDRILILNEGLIAASGTRDEIAARLKGGQEYALTLKTEKSLNREELAGIPRLAAVESFQELREADEPARQAGFKLYEARVSLEAGAEGGDILFDWALSRGLRLRSLTKERYSLETLFSRLTGEDAKNERGGENA